MVREINENDLCELSRLYTQLHDNEPISKTDKTQKIWNQILNDENHKIIVFEKDKKIVSSCVLVIIPNLTHNQQPYALIENVITDNDYRRQGIASQVLDYARKIASENNCYKIMLMTGSKKSGTHKFYQKAGYNRFDKTAYIQWL